MRTAHVRFCGSRGGQPPRLPDEAVPLTAAGRWSYVVAAGSLAAGLAAIAAGRGLDFDHESLDEGARAAAGASGGRWAGWSSESCVALACSVCWRALAAFDGACGVRILG